MATNEHIIKAPGMMKNLAVGGHLTTAEQIYDERLHKDQEDINEDTYRKDEVWNKEEIANLISRTPETDVVVLDVPEGSTAADVLDDVPEEDRPNKLFRLRNDDNTHYDEYGWTGEEWALLASKDYGIDDEPIENSHNLISSDAVAKIIKNSPTTGMKFALVDSDQNVVAYLSNNDVFNFVAKVKCKELDTTNLAGIITLGNIESDYFNFLILDADDNIIIASTKDFGILNYDGAIKIVSTHEDRGDIGKSDVYERNKDKIDYLYADAVAGSKRSDCWTNRASLDNGTKRLQLLITTDTHTNTDNFKNTVDMSNDVSSVDAVINLGDLCNLLNPGADLYEIYEPIIKSSLKPLYIAVGNHDTGTWSSYLMYCKDEETLYNRYIKPSVDKGYLVEGEYEENKCYYYHDFAKEKVRMIILYPYDDGSVLDESKWEAIEYDESYNNIVATTYTQGDKVNVPGWEKCSFEAVQEVTVSYAATHLGKAWEEINGEIVDYHLENNPKFKAIRYYSWFGQEQLDWLADKLLEAQELGYTVVIAQHFPSISGSEPGLEPVSPAAGYSLLNTRFNNPFRKPSIEFEKRYVYEDKNIIAQIVDCFVNGGTINKTVYPYGAVNPADRKYDDTGVDGGGWGLDDASSIDPVILNYTFEGGGKALFISGHNHSDSVVKSETYNLLQVGLLSGYYSDSGKIDMVRTQPDKKDDTMTAVTVYGNTAHLTRIGIDTTIRVGEDNALIKKTNEILTF